MTNPRFIVLAIYPLLLLASAYAVYQSRKLAKVLPSRAWTLKQRVMIFFMAAQVFGIGQNLYFHRPSTWTGAAYFSCTLVFCLGLNWFDYSLLQTNKRLRARIATLSDPTPLSGEMPLDYWRKTFGEVIRENVKDDFLK